MFNHTISPLDGRYHSTVAPLAEIFGEYGLNRRRLQVELDWLETLINHFPPAQDAAKKCGVKSLENLRDKVLSDTVLVRIKELEGELQHDVKSVEVAIAEVLRTADLEALVPFIHFGCTSEDITNTAMAKCLREALDQVILPSAWGLVLQLCDIAQDLKDRAILARTHGQPATPTTLGKEISIFAIRFGRQLESMANWIPSAKFNGATGNYNAHLVSSPSFDWVGLTRNFIENQNLAFNAFTTQIESNDRLAELCHILTRFNVIALDLARDMWGYIGLDFFQLRAVQSEVGSSTMPHKVNPIHFENGEGNLGVANSLLQHLAITLPVSRWQRDLSGSTVLRNVGSALGYCLQSYESISRGLERIDINKEKCEADLDGRWEVLGEAIQTVLRASGESNAYEQSKALLRGQKVTSETLREFIESTALDNAEKTRLLAIVPKDYVGLATNLSIDAVIESKGLVDQVQQLVHARRSL